MVNVFKWLVRILLLGCGLALIAAMLAWYVASNSLPDYDANYTLAGISGDVEIVRDNHAVPHIFAKSENDVFFGLGFVHAQDRLWQMTMLRRTSQGRLSELFGKETLPVDRLLRTLDIYNIARESAVQLDPAILAQLQAYSDGVNAWLKLVQDNALGRGAPEFFLFEPEIAPWTPTDSVAILKLLSLQLSDKAEKEVLRARLALVLPQERLLDILPDAPNPPMMGLKEFAALFPTNAPKFAAAEPRPFLDPLPPIDLAGASNAWAASGKRSASGGTLLAADPHLALNAPSIWMLARLEFPDGGVIGGTIPGLPAVLIGRNADLGWGITSSYVDDQDLTIEKLNPANPEQYLVGETFIPFESHDVVIAVLDSEPETLTIRKSRNGPVLLPEMFGVGDITPPDHVMSLNWTALASDDASAEAMLRLMRTHSVTAAIAATSTHVAPSENLILADHDNIALQVIGAAPLRNALHSSQGRLPSPGWNDNNVWAGFMPFTDNPSLVNPPSGIVVNTNNRTTDAAFPNHVSFDWGDTQRILRAERLLNAREYHTLDSFVEIQTDTVSETARFLLPLIARDLWWSGQPTADDAVARQRQFALERLAGWNGEMSEHDPEPLVYSAWLRALQRRLIIDELGPLQTDLARPDAIFIERVFRDIDGAGIWCDIAQTSKAEICAEMAQTALDDALLELSDKFGPRLESWRWGDAHQAVHRHDVLGRIPVLSWLFNIVQSTSGGDSTLLRGAMSSSGAEPYENIHASGLRVVFDFNDANSSVMIIATGESGHFLSPQYDDQAVLWRRSEYLPMSLDPDFARGGAVGITHLRPLSEQ